MNCKPPCHAYIVNADFPELVGLPVEVLEDFVVDERLGFCWVVRASRPMPCWDSVAKMETRHHEFCIRDADLRPISGVPVHDEQLDKVTA